MKSQEIYARLSTNPKKLWWLLPLSFVTLIVIALGIWFFTHQSQSFVYKTSKVKTLTITQSVSATGTLSPTDTVEVGSQISGRIESVFVDINDEVKEGQIIA